MIERSRLSSATLLRMKHGKANVLDVEFLEALIDAWRECAGVPAVVLTGTGGIFSAGVDLKLLLEEGRGYLERFLPALTRCLRGLYELPRPVIGAINGHAIAGGCIFACACDRRLMARGKGKIGAPELLVGVPFPTVPLDLVRHALAPAVAQEVILTGRLYSPDEALAHGLVDEVVDEDRLLEQAGEVAERLAAIPPVSYARTKLGLRRDVMAAWDRLGKTIDVDTIAAWASPEVRDAVRDYVERTLVK